MSMPRLHAIFARVVFAEDLADLTGKVFVGFRLGLVALLQLWLLAAPGLFLWSTHYDFRIGHSAVKDLYYRRGNSVGQTGHMFPC
jgi:hypothetical protein